MNDSNRQILPSDRPSNIPGLWPGLWVVATPIGNLGDLAPRARLALEIADWVLCEDTRRTATLFSALGLRFTFTKLQRLDAHTENQQILRWIHELQDGKNIALVTDAGTPSMSDPGALLVSNAQDADIRVVPVPGPSAVSALLSVAGMVDTSFTFCGFFPRKLGEQRLVVEQAKNSAISKIFVWFESPRRMVNALEVIAEMCPTVSVVVGKELTKMHEHLFVGTSIEVLQEVKDVIAAVGEVGEWCFALHFKVDKQNNFRISVDSSDEGWTQALHCLYLAGVSPSESSKWVSQQFGVSKKRVYDAALRIFQKKNTEGG